jgi:WD40 repeat protein
MLFTAGADKKVRIWQVSDGAEVGQLEGHVAAVSDVAIQHDGKMFATASLDGKLRLFDAQQKLVKTLTPKTMAPRYSVAFPKTGSFLLSAGADRRWQVWTLTGATPPLTMAGHNHAIQAARYNPAGNKVATLDLSGELFIWQTAGTVVYHRRLPVQSAYGLAYSPDGKELAVATSDARLLLITIPATAQ